MEENQAKCFVPDCFNEVGVLFPTNPEVKKKWLKSLHLEHSNPSSSSFICLDHFDDDGQSSLPKIRNDTSAYITDIELQDSTQHINENIEFDEDSRDVDTGGNKIETEDLNRQKKPIRRENVSTQQYTHSKMCRLCMTQSKKKMENIYEKIDDEHTIAQAILTCLYPLKVSPSDELSQSICQKCLEILREFYEFHQFCLGMDEKQHELISINYDDDDSNATSEDLFLESEDFEEKIDKESQNKTDIDKKFDKVEEELRKVLEGEKINNSLEKANDDTVYTENIVIEMVDDDEPQTQPQVMLNNLKLPITIKTVDADKSARKRKREDSGHSNLTMIKAGANSNEIVVLPSGIKVKVKEKYTSPLGKFSCKIVKYIFNMTYLQSEGYLYKFRLTKGSIRYLQCVALKCPSRAIQKKVNNALGFKNEIEVTVAHNHLTPDAAERRKQMFYNILFKKMHSDNNFNFRALYEQMCRLDHSIEAILPLRKVINEICKHGPLTEMPLVKSFEEFFDTIESDAFHNIHFNEDQIQFYQDKFETENGAKAVVFANGDVVNRYSDSKLMFVDASFNIDTKDFFYQLVTVLVWVQDSYYPLLYAFVNQKSQELYKMIFSFLYDNLAPQLRPEEIITDYEANLYYALGETYVESSIGGSVFYFTQNMYKKICALKLSRELELNSNFRSIYNMILMLPLLPVNTIVDGLKNIEIQAKELNLEHLTEELFTYVHKEWIDKVTPELFCVHRLENRINENIVAPFKKLRDLIMLCKNKSTKNQSCKVSVTLVIEKLIELERFLRDTYNSASKKSFARDLSSSQKKIVLKAWNFIEDHPKININHFFMKVLGYIKCMENQLWIWGFYRYEGNTNDDLINASNFSIISEEQADPTALLEAMENANESQEYEEETDGVVAEYYVEDNGNIKRVDKRTGIISEQFESDALQDNENGTDRQVALVMEAVLNENGNFVLQNGTQ